MADKSKQIFEFRGVDSLFIAKVTRDDNEADGGYECDTPENVPQWQR